MSFVVTCHLLLIRRHKLVFMDARTRGDWPRLKLCVTHVTDTITGFRKCPRRDWSSGRVYIDYICHESSFHTSTLSLAQESLPRVCHKVLLFRRVMTGIRLGKTWHWRGRGLPLVRKRWVWLPVVVCLGKFGIYNRENGNVNRENGNDW